MKISYISVITEHTLILSVPMYLYVILTLLQLLKLKFPFYIKIFSIGNKQKNFIKNFNLFLVIVEKI